MFNLKSEAGASSRRTRRRMIAPCVEDRVAEQPKEPPRSYLCPPRHRRDACSACTAHWLIYAQVPTEGRPRRLGRGYLESVAFRKCAACRPRLRVRQDAEHGRERRRGRRVPRERSPTAASAGVTASQKEEEVRRARWWRCLHCVDATALLRSSRRGRSRSALGGPADLRAGRAAAHAAEAARARSTVHRSQGWDDLGEAACGSPDACGSRRAL